MRLLQFTLSFFLVLAVAAEPVPLALNHLQHIGTHNSYKPELSAPLQEFWQSRFPAELAKIDYGHPPLAAQLAMGIRQLELDLLLDNSGNKFSQPLAEQLSKTIILSNAEREALAQPGIKVLHMPDIDFQSHCQLLQQCLAQLRQWSSTNPSHFPILILINIKETASPLPGATAVDVWQPEDYRQLDALLLAELGAERLLRPDDVRQPGLTLRDSVLQHGWGELAPWRGRFFFVLDGPASQLAAYRQGYPSLSGRVMFGDYPADSAEAAILLRNDPVANFEEIRQLVESGFLVRTRSDDIGKLQAEPDRFSQAIASGAQFISTDFYPGAPQQRPQQLAVIFPEQRFSRCHPFLAVTPCELPVDVTTTKHTYTE